MNIEKEKFIGKIQDLINEIEASDEIDIPLNDTRSQMWEDVLQYLLDAHNRFIQ